MIRFVIFSLSFLSFYQPLVSMGGDTSKNHKKEEKKSSLHSSLKDALIGGHNNNLDLQVQQKAIKAIHEQYVQATAGFKPTITLGATIAGAQSIHSGRIKLDPREKSGKKDNVRDASISIKQNLYQGGGTLAATRSADQRIKGEWKRFHSLQQKVFLDIIKVHLELYAKQSEIEQRLANEKAMEKSYETAQQKFKVGDETRTQVAHAEAKLADATAKLAISKAQFDALKASYFNLTGLEAPKKFFKPGIPSILVSTLQEAINIAQKDNPEILAAEFDYHQKRFEIDEHRSSLLPRVDLEGKSTRSESRSITDFTSGPHHSADYTTNHQVLLSVNFSLYDGGVHRSRARAAAEEATSRKINIENKKQGVIEKTIESWKSREAAKHNIHNFEKQVKAREIAVEGTQQELLVGTKVLLDLLDAQAHLLEASLGKIDAEKTYYFECFRLLSLLGLLTPETLNLPVETFNPGVHYRSVQGIFKVR